MRFCLILFTAFLSGCASILAGRHQTITVESSPTGAACTFEREGKIIGTVNPTPGSLMVIKTKHDIVLSCEKQGYQDSKQFLDSGTEGATFANIVAGGVIGWGIDSAVGADNKYPETVTVTLVPAPLQTK